MSCRDPWRQAGAPWGQAMTLAAVLVMPQLNGHCWGDLFTRNYVFKSGFCAWLLAQTMKVPLLAFITNNARMHAVPAAGTVHTLIGLRKVLYRMAHACSQIFTKRVKKGVWDLKAIVDSGGMPSSHSALCTVRSCSYTHGRYMFVSEGMHRYQLGGLLQSLYPFHVHITWRTVLYLKMLPVGMRCSAMGLLHGNHAGRDDGGGPGVWPGQLAICRRALLHACHHVRRRRRALPLRCHISTPASRCLSPFAACCRHRALYLCMTLCTRTYFKILTHTACQLPRHSRVPRGASSCHPCADRAPGMFDVCCREAGRGAEHPAGGRHPGPPRHGAAPQGGPGAHASAGGVQPGAARCARRGFLHTLHFSQLHRVYGIHLIIERSWA